MAKHAVPTNSRSKTSGQRSYRKGRLATAKAEAHIPSAQPFFKNVKKQEEANVASE